MRTRAELVYLTRLVAGVGRAVAPALSAAVSAVLPPVEDPASVAAPDDAAEADLDAVRQAQHAAAAAALTLDALTAQLRQHGVSAAVEGDPDNGGAESVRAVFWQQLDHALTALDAASESLGVVALVGAGPGPILGPAERVDASELERFLGTAPDTPDDGTAQ